MDIETLEELGKIEGRQTVNLRPLLSKLGIMTLGMDVVLPYQRFTKDEKTAFDVVYNYTVKAYEKKLPEVAEFFRARKDVARVIAEVFKAKLPTTKTFRGFFPGSNELGMQQTAPKDIRYVASPTPTDPAYSHYALNSWDITFTAGTTRYLLGDGTNWYKPSPKENARATHVLMGLLEVGTTPVIDQILYRGIRAPEEGYPIVIEQLLDLSIEKEMAAYLYVFPHALLSIYDYEIMIGVMPRKSVTSNIRLLGFTFYEHEYFRRLKWIA